MCSNVNVYIHLSYYNLFQSKKVMLIANACTSSQSPLPTALLQYPSRCSGTAQRSMANPLGQQQHESVKNGNVLAARTMLIAMIAASLGCWWIVEQPTGSWMECLPVWQDVMSRMDVYRHSTQMAKFGSLSKKPTWLYSSPSFAFI